MPRGTSKYRAMEIDAITMNRHLGDGTHAVTLCYHAAVVYGLPSTYNRSTSTSPPDAAHIQCPPAFVRAPHPPRIQRHREIPRYPHSRCLLE